MRKVSELEGVELDYWVARAEGLECKATDGGWRVFDKQDEFVGRATEIPPVFSTHYRPSLHWIQAGPIIERIKPHSINYPMYGDDGRPAWMVRVYRGNVGFQYVGPTLPIAAMRAYVASVFGMEVEDA